MTLPQTSFATLEKAWDRFFFAEEDALPYTHLRVLYSLLILIHNAAMYPSLQFFYGQNGTLPYEVSRQVIGPWTTTLFSVLPHTDFVMFSVFWIMTLAAVALLLGVFSRVSAIVLYVCLVSFNHRNNLITDGEDTMFRLVGFLILFMPLGKFLSFDRTLSLLRGKTSAQVESRKAWPSALRILQVYMSFMLFCAFWWKMKGSEWVTGTALYYVARLDDFFGRFPVPSFPFEYLPLTRVLTWSVVWAEGLVPFLIWFKETRRYALLVIVAFHLGCDYAMNLFLFHWIMLLGWSAFLSNEELRKVGAVGHWIFTRLGVQSATITYDGAAENSQRVAAVLTEWDIFSILKFDNTRRPGKKTGEAESFVVTNARGTFYGLAGVRQALRSTPAAWWLLPLTFVPGVASWSGWPANASAKIRRAG